MWYCYSLTSLLPTLFLFAQCTLHSQKKGIGFVLLLNYDCTLKEWMECTKVFVFSRLCRHRYLFTWLICPNYSRIKFAIRCWRFSRCCRMKSIVLIIPHHSSTR